MSGEFDLIDGIVAALGEAAASGGSVSVGPGDDAAVLALPAGDELVVSTDALVRNGALPGDRRMHDHRSTLRVNTVLERCGAAHHGGIGTRKNLRALAAAYDGSEFGRGSMKNPARMLAALPVVTAVGGAAAGGLRLPWPSEADKVCVLGFCEGEIPDVEGRVLSLFGMEAQGKMFGMNYTTVSYGSFDQGVSVFLD